MYVLTFIQNCGRKTVILRNKKGKGIITQDVIFDVHTYYIYVYLKI